MLDRNEEETPSAVAATVAPSGWRSRAPWFVATAAVLALFLAAIPSRLREAASAPPAVRFEIPAPDGRAAAEPVLSNDGSLLVFATDRLHVRELAAFESRELPGTVGATQPFLSPDGKWVGFYADGKIKKVALAGGDPLVITDAVPNSPGAAFITNDQILFSRTWNQAPLVSVSANGGAVTPVSTLDTAAGERGHWWPRPLPDGRHVLFTIWYAAAGLSASKVAALDLETGTHQVLFPGAMAQYFDGHLLYYRAGQYQVVPFDPSTLKVTGESRPVLSDALGLDRNGSSVDPLSVAPNGTIAYSAGDRDPVLTLTWIDRSGQRTPIPLTLAVLSGGSEAVSLSPDERQIAVSRPLDGMSQVWVYDVHGGGERRLPGPGSSFGPVWSRDGRHIAYTSLRKGDFDVFIQTLDGTEKTALATDADDQVLDWLSDGRMLTKKWLPDGTVSFSLLDIESGQTTPLVTGDFRTEGGAVSPDGRWLALCAAPSGRMNVYVRSLSGAGGLQQLAAAGSTDCGARWFASTRELAFMRGASVVVAAYDARGDRLVPVRETVIATVAPGSELYGLTRDGKRLLVGVPQMPRSADPGIRVIVSGISSLSRAAGAGAQR
jgi:serine/threonine-protein kinase